MFNLDADVAFFNVKIDFFNYYFNVPSTTSAFSVSTLAANYAPNETIKIIIINFTLALKNATSASKLKKKLIY